MVIEAYVRMEGVSEGGKAGRRKTVRKGGREARRDHKRRGEMPDVRVGCVGIRREERREEAMEGGMEGGEKNELEEGLILTHKN